ncbi:MAG: VCBS repeat-containing protein [Planctomycetes bacterium]|nr:VCBS repeat-containing protein [Planctomycetota bacterium]
MRRSTASFVFGLAPLLTATSAFAFQQPIFVTHHNDVPATSPPINKEATTVIQGDFSGHGSHDVVYRFQDEACLFYAPGSLKLAMMIPGLRDFTDLGSLSPAANSTQDRIAATDPNGLTVWTYSKGAGLWSKKLEYGPNAALWMNATLLRRADVDGDGIDDLVGVRSDLHGVVIGYCDAAGALTTQLGPVFARSLLDLTVGNVDSDPALEFCGLQDNGVSIREIDGTPTFFMRGTQPGYAVTTLHRAGQLDQFAWITKAALSANTIVYAINSTTYEPAIDLGADVGRALVAADYDRDGFDDLLVSQANTGLRRLYRRLAGVPSFSVAESSAVNCESLSSPEPNAANAAFVDLDGDDVPEISIYSNVTQALCVLQRDTPVRTSAFVTDPCESLDAAIVGANFKSTELPTWTGATSELELLVDRDAWNFAGIPALNAFEVYVYKQHLNGPGTMTLSSKVRRWNIFLARSTGSGTYEAQNTTYLTGAGLRAEHLLRIPLTFGPMSSQTAMPQMDWATAGPDFRFYVEIRACTYTPSASGGTITNRKRLFKYGLSGSPDYVANGSTQGLESFALAQPNGSVLPFNCTAYAATTGGGGAGGVKIGGFVAMSSLPDFELSPIEWPTVILIGTF